MLKHSLALEQLRSISESDLPFLKKLYATTREKEMGPVPWPDAQKMLFLQSQFQLQHNYYQQQFTNGEFKIIDINGEPVGRLYYAWEKNNLRLIDIALLPAFQKKGIGKYLMLALMELVNAIDGKLLLHVDINNPIRNWYLRLGFLPEDTKSPLAGGVYEQLGWRAPDKFPL